MGWPRVNKYLIIVVLAGLSLLSISCGHNTATTKSASTKPAPVKHPPKGVVRVSVTAVGDIMVHQPQLAAAYDSSTGTYNFSSFFAEVTNYLNKTDLTIGNLETTLSGKEKDFTGYPMFNSPDELATALKDSGFDILNTANNHSLDRRVQGLQRTIEVLDRVGIKHTGTFKSPTARAKPVIFETKGLKIAYISFTYGTNGMPVPKEQPFCINLMDTEQIKMDIKKAKEQGADFVIVMAHFGNEYQIKPNEQQQSLAQEMVNAGADVILGTHPHVLQPLAWLTQAASPKQSLVAYSLGNFISSQTGLEKASGAVLYFELEKNLDNGSTSILNVNSSPTWVHRYNKKGKTYFRVLPVQDALKSYAEQKDATLSAGDNAQLKQVFSLVQGRLKDEK